MASDPNPYQSPLTTETAYVPGERIPGEILRRIRQGWGACVFSGLLTVVCIAFGVLPSVTLLDVALIFGLAFGIYRRSRTCAVLMLIYFILNRIYFISSLQSSGLVGAIILGYFHINGVRGTFAYHRWRRELDMRSPRPDAPIAFP